MNPIVATAAVLVLAGTTFFFFKTRKEDEDREATTADSSTTPELVRSEPAAPPEPRVTAPPPEAPPEITPAAAAPSPRPTDADTAELEPEELEVPEEVALSPFEVTESAPIPVVPSDSDILPEFAGTEMEAEFSDPHFETPAASEELATNASFDPAILEVPIPDPWQSDTNDATDEKVSTLDELDALLAEEGLAPTARGWEAIPEAPSGLDDLDQLLAEPETAAAAPFAGKAAPTTNDPDRQEALETIAAIVAEIAGRSAGKEVSLAIDLLSKFSLDPDATVRREATAALGHIPNAEAIPYLERALRDSDSEVAQAASEAIARYKFYGSAPQRELPPNGAPEA